MQVQGVSTMAATRPPYALEFRTEAVRFVKDSGAPRVHAELALGQRIRRSRKRVARLMRLAGLVGVHRRRLRGCTRRNERQEPQPDLVRQDFTASGPNRLWVADLTQHTTGEGWLYLATVLDVFSRRVVGWAMGARDLVIVCRGRAEEALTWLRWITEKLGLSLNEAKTRVCDAERETFDFLGYTFGPMVFRRTGKTYVGVAPSKKRVKRFKESLRTEPHVANHAPLNEVVAAVNHKLRGWSRHFSVGTLEPSYRTVDRYAEALFRQFLVRRHKVPGRGTRPFSKRYLYGELGLVRSRDRRRMSRLHALT